MNLWGVCGVMGSSLESVGMSFGVPPGVIFGALGCHFGSFLVHFWSLGGSFWELFDPFWEPWGSFWAPWGSLGDFLGGLVPWGPSDGSAPHTFRILSRQSKNRPKERSKKLQKID